MAGFNKIPIGNKMPAEEGKYIVFTETTPMKKVNVFKCPLHIGKNPKGELTYSWGCSNQIVTHWLEETES